MKTSIKAENSEISNLLIGKWINQHGSQLSFSKIDGDKLIGTFHSGVGADDPGKEYLVTGSVTHNLVAFVVNFEHHGCLTSWVGHYINSNGTEIIDSMWHLARVVPERKEDDMLWTGIWTGADRFERKVDLERDLSLYTKPSIVTSYPFRISKTA